MAFHVPNQYRVRTGSMRSDDSYGNNGAFFIKQRPGILPPLRVLASDGEGWQRCSVSYPDRCPSWPEMCVVKALFWDEEDCVMQLHPPRSEYINNHPYCLHLWRPTAPGVEIPRPAMFLVGAS